MKVRVFKVVLSVVDHDGIGADSLRDVLESTRYPNRCISPTVVGLKCRSVDWTDEHPLNYRAQHAEAFRALFCGEELPDEPK